MPISSPDSWSISADQHARFIAASGDHNMLHADPVAARRLPFGRVAVHGVHLVLAAIDRAGRAGRDLTRLRASFRHPVTPGDALATMAPGDDLLSIDVDVWRAVDIAVDSAIDIAVDIAVDSAVDTAVAVSEPWPGLCDVDISMPDPERVPSTWSLEDLGRDDLSEGSIAIEADGSLLDDLFPSWAEAGMTGVLAELVTVSRLVGMHMPGTHSLLAGFDVRIGETRASPGSLSWRLRVVDERFSRLVLDVESPNLSGSVDAFVRPAPVTPEVGDVRPVPGAFANQRWLVIGGSRGLGAVATLLLDAGGADVRFTYHRGADDARSIQARTERAVALQLDIDSPEAAVEALRADDWAPTHLAYFASPPIFDGAAGAWSDALFQRFRSAYLDRFTALVELLGPASLRGVLWPSTTAVETPVRGLDEYAAAKRAGEQWCRQYAADQPEAVVSIPRFGRLATDQTTSVVPVENDPPAPAVLEALSVFVTGD